MLLLVGLGLGEGDISVRALDALKKADQILAERYTLSTPGSYLSAIEKETGKKIKEVPRPALEDSIEETLGPGLDKALAILVPGDPLVATTHHTILDTAKKLGIEVKIYHSSSIFTAAIGESGLDIYKFGPTTTIPFWSEKYKPTSFIDTIRKNLDNGEHTLVLLDVDAKGQKSMSAAEAAAILKKAEEAQGSALGKVSKVLVLCDVGSPQQSISYTELPQKGNAERPASRTALIIPAKLNFAEEEHLRRLGA